MMVLVNGSIADVRLLRFKCGRMRFMNQLRGKVTLCTRPCKLTLLTMMNIPESLSTRSHK